MGAAASFVKTRSIRWMTRKEKENEIREALDNIQMVEDQLTAFYEMIGLSSNASYDIKLIPIKKVVRHYHYIQCAESKQDDIGNAITDSVKDFSTGPLAEGLANLDASVISRLSGSSKSIRLMESKYAISIDPLGSISRLNSFFFLIYNFEATGLMKTAKSVVASCVVKSSADTKEVDDNTLRVLVNECLGASPLELRKAIYSEITKRSSTAMTRHTSNR